MIEYVFLGVFFFTVVLFTASLRLAEEHKSKGNAAYKAGRYEEARECYSRAIFHNPNCATYWSNRSAALMMLEDYGSALDDCTQSIKLDEAYTKVYWKKNVSS